MMMNTNTNTKKMIKACALFLQEDSGQNLIEYALVAGIIGLGAVVAMTSLGTKISSAFTSIGSSLTSAI